MISRIKNGHALVMAPSSGPRDATVESAREDLTTEYREETPRHVRPQRDYAPTGGTFLAVAICLLVVSFSLFLLELLMR
jgi:hypothetical protein